MVIDCILMLNLMLRRRRRRRHRRWPILFLCTFFSISLFVHKQIVFIKLGIIAPSK